MTQINFCLARIALAASVMLIVAAPTSAQDWQRRYSANELLTMGSSAYRAVPERPSPADAPTFLVALASLRAYAEVSQAAQTNSAHGREVREALDWLYSNLRSVTPASSKGDDPRPRWQLFRTRGLAAFDSIRNHPARVRSPFQSYAAATINLFAARQMTEETGREVVEALRWLSANRVGMSSGGKGDDPRSGITAFPRGRKPGALVARPVRPTSLTGSWRGNDGGTYHVRQIGRQVWWLGESPNNGTAWTNVFHGTIDSGGRTVSGAWTDVKGQATGEGRIVLTIVSSTELRATKRTGGFGGSVWRR